MTEDVYKNKHNTPEFKAIADQHTIYETVVGSGLCGISVSDQDDIDLLGICIEPPQYIVGGQYFEQYQYRTQPEGARSGPGDIDRTVYSLKKWAHLALGGNPTVILPLFAPTESIVNLRPEAEDLLTVFRTLIRTRQTGRAFLGYMQAQRDRMMGLRGGRDVNRHELIEKYGFDTKFAGHAVRLGMQGSDFLQYGVLELPMPKEQRELVVEIRTGQFAQDEVIRMCEALIGNIEKYLAVSDWDDKADYEFLYHWLAQIYQQYWREHGYDYA